MTNIFFHQSVCNYGNYSCPNCTKSGLLNKDMANHALECENRKISCPKCSMNIKFIEIQEHLKNSCLEILSSCIYCELPFKKTEIVIHSNYCKKSVNNMRIVNNSVMSNENQKILNLLFKILSLLNNNSV